MQTVYLDNNASTPVAEEALAAVRRCLETVYGNPSSLHTLGIAAERELNAARRELARLLGTAPGEVYFCSGATEANNTLISGVAGAYRARGAHIVTTTVEHPSVLEPVQELERNGFAVTYIAPHPVRGISPQQVRDALREDTVLVSIMQVNNETGAVFPVEEIARAVKAVRSAIVVHSDGVQGFGKLPAPTGALDAYSVSAHKLHGPKGVGAFYLRDGVRCKPLLLGGRHENGLRAGTENLPGVAGFAAAATAAEEHRGAACERLQGLRNELVTAFEEIPDALVLSPPDALASTVTVAFPPIPGEVMVNALSEQGVSVSTGAACAASRGKRSHVLSALGFERRSIDSAVRFSLSRLTTEDEIRRVIELLEQTVARLRPVAERVLQ